eukprot:scaffold527_cov368-Prasinococcus_capsulatus_cf.AAC.56
MGIDRDIDPNPEFGRFGIHSSIGRRTQVGVHSYERTQTLDLDGPPAAGDPALAEATQVRCAADVRPTRARAAREWSGHETTHRRGTRNSRPRCSMGDADEFLAAVLSMDLDAQLGNPALQDVYKEECSVTFDTPDCAGGLYIDLKSFNAFNAEYAERNAERTGHQLYLRYRRTEIPKSDSDENPPKKKPTRMGMGVEGGFQTDAAPEYSEDHSIVVLPSRLELAYPAEALPEQVQSVVLGVIAKTAAEKTETVAAFVEDDFKVMSKFADNLVQLDNGIKISPNPDDWVCAESGMKENLWLNLSTGYIGSGRRQWDGSGGTGAALKHYEETGRKYPLCVKLGTITPEGADVYSYDPSEDDLVTLPKEQLSKYLAHWGIDVMTMTKTEKTMEELTLDLNSNFEFSLLTEEGQELENAFGPGLTGLVNLGNSCYMASVMQVLLSTQPFISTYFSVPLVEFYQQSHDPATDLAMQMAKLANGLLSGTYSKPAGGDEKRGQKGILPRRFKRLVGKGHAEFSTSRQQDAFEFFQHILSVVERDQRSRGTSASDPSRAFSFKMEERIQCSSSKKVKYNHSITNALSLEIPIERATNTTEVKAFEEDRKAKEAAGEKVTNVVLPNVPLSECLSRFASTEVVDDFYSSAIKGKTMGLKSNRFATFPDYLVLHMRKFVLAEGWVPRKLDVQVDVPDELDVSTLKGNGLQGDEEMLPEEEEAPLDSQPTPPAVADEAIVAQLVNMGFAQSRCEKATIMVNNGGVEQAMNWLLEHMEDPDIDEPLVNAASNTSTQNPASEEHIEMLGAMGFDRTAATKALAATGNNIERAADWLFSRAGELEEMDVDGTAAGNTASLNGDVGLPNRDGKYRLLGFVSHIGRDTGSGHYVCHIKKGGKWYLFNDEKVALSAKPPTKMGYLYFYEAV